MDPCVSKQSVQLPKVRTGAGFTGVSIGDPSLVVGSDGKWGRL